MARRNVYSGNCMFCGIFVAPKKGYIKMKNPQRGENIGKRRDTPRKYGVLCDKDFAVYAKSMAEKYHAYAY